MSLERTASPRAPLRAGERTEEPPAFAAAREVEFWSSVSGHAFQHALLEELSRAGWTSTERCLVPHEAYRRARGAAARLWLRFRMYAVYPLQVVGHFVQAPCETITVLSSSTFYAPWLALRTAPADVPVIHWVLDLYPDAIEAAGKLAPTSAVARVLRGLMRQTVQRAAANVFLGEHLLRHAERSVGPIHRAEVIPIGADGTPFQAHPPQPREGAGHPLRVLYCGNMGHMHDVETIGTVLEDGLPEGIAVRFCGNGAGFSALSARIDKTGERPNVSFSGNLPEAEWVDAMLAADIALVTMRPGAERVVMPSKAYSAMVAGQAILAVCPAVSDLADLIRAHDLGWIVEPGDHVGLRRVMENMARDRDDVLVRRRRAWDLGHRLFDQRVIAQRWTALFERVARETKTAVV